LVDTVTTDPTQGVHKTSLIPHFCQQGRAFHYANCKAYGDVYNEMDTFILIPFVFYRSCSRTCFNL